MENPSFFLQYLYRCLCLPAAAIATSSITSAFDHRHQFQGLSLIAQFYSLERTAP